ncbi:trypsin-like serine peptidase [Methylobacterium planeticum]|uniref:Serine protease n=1 Tax=Methylobacterium planeticum TaxID=2615211 RepID=A0A6N6MD62_9HYPH|nr:serine protease [Methylobacterium planeticum]KAB1068602.1 trypsin-like peptidase domain-containing protein [Methylobacterium planeticum]
MADELRLEGVSADDIRSELQARSRPGEPTVTASEADAPASPLSSVPTGDLVAALATVEKGIYGVDDRKDFYEFPSDDVRRVADSVAALFRAGDVVSNGDGTSTLRTETLQSAQRVCAKERFAAQPTGAFCTGFLVGPDLVATAGHCVNEGNVTTVRFVFGFRMTDETTAVGTIADSDIYSGRELVGRVLEPGGSDWALVRLDREAGGRRPLTIRTTAQIAQGAAVSVMGHPSGLPLKFADGAEVRDNSARAFFVANLDTYGGNSGSPVFGANFVVEGILVRGGTDYLLNVNCYVSKVCPSTGCRGEDCTRITELPLDKIS